MSLIRPVPVEEKDSDDHLRVASLQVDNNISRLSYCEANSTPRRLVSSRTGRNGANKTCRRPEMSRTRPLDQNLRI